MPDLPTPITAYHPHSLLRVYAYYRVVLAAVLIVFFHPALSPFPGSVLGNKLPTLYTYTVYSYAGLSLLTLLRLNSRRFESSSQSMFLVCFVDVLCLALMMHASGSVDSGLGLLLLVTVSAAAITLNSQIASLIAALATLSVLTSVVSEALTTPHLLNNLLPAGLLGFLFFVTSQLFLYLTRRIRLSVEEAELQARRRAEAQRLNEMIVQRMRTGLVVLDPQDRIRLINDSALRLLDLPPQLQDHPDQLARTRIPGMADWLRQWRLSPRTRLKPLRLRDDGPELQLSFATLNPSEASDTLVFVEDVREMTQQAQQMKLASLGHLTANIAHEVRNPLGAISHAAQLLSESPDLPPHDRRLSDIIQTHSRRVNQIIENVLRLSRRSRPQPERLVLADWLEHFVQRYHHTHQGDIHIDIQCSQADMAINVDASQLEQVLTNLCDNGLRHSAQASGRALVTLYGYPDPTLGTPCLDVVDDGPGIPDELLPNIFEPFFTTESQGTGLGLYIAREICEANRAQLVYRRTTEGKSCFHISFSHPDKSILDLDIS